MNSSVEASKGHEPGSDHCLACNQSATQSSIQSNHLDDEISLNILYRHPPGSTMPTDINKINLEIGGI